MSALPKLMIEPRKSTPRLRLSQTLRALIEAIQEIASTLEYDFEPPVERAPPTRFESPMHAAIYEAATGSPMSTKSLARRAGYPWHSMFRQAVADLVRSGLLARVPEGVKRA